MTHVNLYWFIGYWKNKSLSEKHKKAIGVANKGHKHSKITVDKMSKKMSAHGKIVDWKNGSIQFVIKDSTQGLFSGAENILINDAYLVGSKFYSHVVKAFGNDLKKLKIEIILHK